MHWSHAWPKRKSRPDPPSQTGKSQPSNRIFCGHDFTRQIIGRGASRQRLCAFVCQIADQPAYHRRAATGSAGKRSWHPLGQTEECGKIDHRLAALIGFEFFKHLPRHAILNRNRKQGPKDHIRGGKAGLGLYLHRAAPGLGSKTCHGRLCGCRNRRIGLAQTATLKCGINDPALPLPFGAIGRKYAVAQKRPQPLADTV